MEDKPVAAPLTVAGSADAQGNVTVWDNEPKPPVPIIMGSGDAAHAMAADPERYSLEPLGVDDGAVAAKVKEIQELRSAKVKAQLDRLEALQLAADRKEAIGAVMADQAAAAVDKKAADVDSKRLKGSTVTGKEMADKIEADRRVEREKVTASSTVPPLTPKFGSQVSSGGSVSATTTTPAPVISGGVSSSGI